MVESMSENTQHDAVEVIEYDVSQQVRIGDPDHVQAAVRELFITVYPIAEFGLIARAFQDVTRMYRGQDPQFHRCDTSYHNLRHVLDVTLTVARLIVGYEQEHIASRDALGLTRVQLGIICALFHDIGYLRHVDHDASTENGAEFTRTHVSRGAEILRHYLPTIGFANEAERTRLWLHYTGYEQDVHMDNALDHALGCLLGTGDLISQMADRAYLERCRDGLYQEFKIGKVPAPTRSDGLPFESPHELLQQTPNFMRHTVTDRLDKRFGQVYRYAERFFGGVNLYMEGVEKNCVFLEHLLQKQALNELRRRVAE